MILIKSDKLEIIKSEYVAAVSGKVSKLLTAITDLIDIFNAGNPVTNDIVRGRVDNFTKALQIIANNKELKSGDTDELVNNINQAICKKPRYANRIKDINDSLMAFTDSSIFDLLNSHPSLLKDIQTTILNNIKLPDKDILIATLFNYKTYYKNEIDPIAQKLGIVVCPYCNRNFITHIVDDDGEKIIGPNFDHFFHQAENPLLTISFFNLIPSCSLCNSNLKNQRKFEFENNLHPYFHEMGQHATFDFDLDTIDISDVSDITFKPKIKINVLAGSDEHYRLLKSGRHVDSGSIDVFRLREVYASHYDIVKEIHTKFDENSPHYVKSITASLSALGATEAEFYRFHFGNYFHQHDFHKRPLAKLTKDIYDKMKAINGCRLD